MLFKRMLSVILLLFSSVMIFGEENYEGYINIGINNFLKYNFAKIYTDEKFEKIYVNLSELLELVELDTLKYNPEKKVIEGYIPHQLISGSDSDKEILYNINENAITKDGEIYVEYREIPKIFPTDEITWSSSELFLNINYNFMIPAELKQLRSGKRKRDIYKEDKSDKDDDVVRVRREMMSPGILSLNFSWSDFDSGDKNLYYQYNSIFLNGELSLSGELYEDQSLDYYRQDYDNILENKTISLGKTTLFNTPSIFNGNSSIKGLSINRKSVNFTTQSNQGEETIEGFAPVNSTVELYQNNFLIDYQSVEDSGSFSFSEIQSKSFSDSYAVKIYDERGFLLEERKYNSMFKNNFLKKGETDYQLALGEGVDDKVMDGFIDFYWGIFDRITYNPGFYYSENSIIETDDDEEISTDRGKNIFKNSFLYRSKMITYPYYTKSDIYTDVENLKNSYYWEYIQKIFYGLQAGLYYVKNDEEMEDFVDYSESYKVVLAKNFRKIYTSLIYKSEKVFDDDDDDDEEYYTGQISYTLNDSTRIDLEEEYDNIEKDHSTTLSLDYIFDDETDLIFEVGTGWGGDSDSDSASIFISKTPDRKKSPYTISAGIELDRSDGSTEWSGSIRINYYFGTGGTFTGKYDSDDKATFGMNYKASINLARPFEYNPPEAYKSSWIEGDIFLDENLNEKKDEGETTLEGVEIYSGQKKTLSNENGYYYLGGISPKKVNEIKYSYKNLDPSLISLNDKNKVLIPSTEGYYHSIPLVQASGITGFVKFDPSLEINERLKEMIFARMQIQILQNGKVVKEIPVETGGFYILDGLKPGKYKVKGNYLGVKEMTFEEEVLLEINPAKYGNFYEDVNLKVKTYK